MSEEALRARVEGYLLGREHEADLRRSLARLDPTPAVLAAVEASRAAELRALPEAVERCGGRLPGMTATRTHTHTLTEEEKAVMAAVGVRRSHRPGRWRMDQLQDFIDTHAGLVEGVPGAEDLMHVQPDLTPVVVGQLIERGLVERCGTEPETYRRA